MTPTPRTDAIAHRGLGSVAYIAEMTSLGRELERELAAKDAHADEIYKAAVNLAAKLEDDLAAEREQLAANHAATRLMGKWLEAERELADRLAETLRFIDEECDWKEGGDYGSVTYGDNRIGPACDKALAAWKEARRGTH